MARRKTNKANNSEKNPSVNPQDGAMVEEKEKGFRAGKAEADAEKHKTGQNQESESQDKKSKVVIYTGAKNPIEMHSMNEAYLEPIGKLPEMLRYGHPIEKFVVQQPANPDTSEFEGLKLTSAMQSEHVGGVMVMKFIPAIGEANSATDAVNVGITTQFNAVRAATSGTQYFESPDLGIYDIAMSSCYAYYASICRIYGLLKSYQVKNMYSPEGILYAHGIDWEDLDAHSEDFRSWINLWSYKFEQIMMPTGLEFINRHIWLNSNIYMDSPETQSQLYMFVQCAFFQLQEGISAHSMQYYQKKQVKVVDNDLWYLKLIPAPWCTSDGTTIKYADAKEEGLESTAARATFADLRDFGEALFAPLNASQDIKHISAAYNKAFNDFMKLNPIDETYQVTPVYNEEVLAQIENAMTTPFAVRNYSYTIQEDVSINKGYLVGECNMMMAGNTQFDTVMTAFGGPSKGQKYLNPNNVLFEQHIVNSHGKRLDPVFVMEASRMMGPTSYRELTSDEVTALKQYAVNPGAQSNFNTSSVKFWHQVHGMASEIMIGYDFVTLSFRNVQKPWAGIQFDKWFSNLATTRILASISTLMKPYLNEITQAAIQNAILNVEAQLDANTMLWNMSKLLLTQWDWHPRFYEWNAQFYIPSNVSNSTGTSPASVLPCYAMVYLGETLDINTLGLIGLDQLTRLHDYDMLTQFSLAQADKWNAQ